jgi:subtilisin family serine protease
MKQLFRLIFTLVVCLGLPAGGGAAQGDPFHKAGRGRLSGELDRMARDVERGRQVKSMSRAYNKATGRVTVVIELAAGAAAQGVSAVVQAAGGRVEGVAGNLVKATLAPGGLREVAAHPDVLLVRTPYRPNAKKAGAAQSRREIVSQGVNVIAADAYRARTGANGSGVTVAVMDGGFAGVLDLFGNEVPEATFATDYLVGNLEAHSGDPHGTACAEIVHDVAPGAAIWLGAFEDEVAWANRIDELVSLSGTKIVSHSLGWDNIFPPDGNNFFAQKVDQVSARNVLFVTAAGNEGANYYKGRWSDVNGDGFLEFVNGGLITPALEVYLGPPASTVVLRWDDAFGRSNHDYDIALVTPEFLDNPAWSADNPAIVEFSAEVQNGGGNPVERIDVTVEEPTVLYLVVRHDPITPENASQGFSFWAQNGVEPAFANGSGTLSMPGDARSALTVGAVAWDSRGLEGYSSRGPTADGRVKPDLVAPDRVSTASYGAEFPGTSAATPHVAGAAALLLSRNPSLTAAALRQALELATPSGGSVTLKNNDIGFGLLDLNRAP